MATVSHYAMQPYPALYGDGSTQLSPSQYYVASNQHQLSQMYDKTKKTWSQRLKITKTEKSPSPLNELPDYSQSALSRSMKYAEPWLYGTVRGIPARPVHGQAIFTPMPSELAVVVCSCPEYLNGTKKEMKKASICKKCKGSRLPLAPIGGTVRLRPTSAPVVHAPRGSVGTVRLPSSSSMKSRPSILDPKNDPYDLMRRSRLLTPEPKAVSNEKPMKTRAKSTSPTRGRSRSRITRLAPEDPAPIANNNNGNSSNNRPRSATRTKQERWLDTMEHDPGGRRSILRCDINPYELISSKPHTNNEFAPDHDDMFHPSAMPETMAKSPIKVNYSNVKAIAGQRISLGETMTQRGDHLPYEQHKPKQGPSPAKHDGNGLSKIHKRTESFASNKDTELSGLVTQPKRPPRRKQETSSADEDNEMPERSTKAANELDTTSTMHSPTLSLSYISSLESSNTPRQGIKSILKRPSSVSSSSSDIDAKNNDLRTDNLGAATTIDIPGSHAVSLVRAGEKSSYDRTAGTQFYLPLPQTRKKVQFMVENRIIHHEVEDESLGRRMDPPAAWQTNNEQSFKDANGFRDENKSKQQQILDLLQQEQDEREKRAAAVAIAKDDSKKMASNSTQNCVIVVNQEQKNGSIMPPTEKQNGEWGGLNGQANIDKESTIESRFSSRKGSSLRRTHSARSTNTTTVLLNFNDTMALRIKNIRPDSRNIFPQNGRDAILRPKEQPPLPPQNYCSAQIASPAIGLLSSQQNTKTSDRHAADRNPSLNGYSQQDNENRQQMESDPVTDDGEGQPARPPRQTNRKISWQENGVVTIKNESDNPREENNGPDKENTAANESLSAKDELNLVSIPAVALKLEQVSQTIAAKKSDKERMLQAQREIFNGTRLFGNQNNKNGQKTVVRVAPFSTASSEIHRLKIRHEDENNFANIAQKKTSILINGDDCYSTVNVNNDTPLYQSSVVVTDGTCISPAESLKVSSNTVTINVSSPRTPEEEIIYKNNKINTLLNLNTSKAVIPITGEISGIGSSGDDSNPSSPLSDGDSSSSGSLKRGRTLITLDFDSKQSDVDRYSEMLLPHEEELVKILRNPVEAVKRNLIPHVCGKTESNTSTTVPTTKTTAGIISNGTSETLSGKQDRSSFIGKLLEDPTLSQLAEGLESEVVVKLIENSLKRLKDSRTTVDTSGTKDNDDMNKLIDMSLQKIKEERIKLETKKRIDPKDDRDNHDQQENESNRGSISSGNSYGSANYDLFEFDNNESDCYQSCSSEMTTEDDANSTKSKFYQMLVDATLSEIEISTSLEDDLHHYESIRLNCDPIYEEISEVPPPLPLSPPPLNDPELEKKNTRSMFEGASKYDILSYLVDAKERGIVREESYEYNFGNTSDIIVEEEIDTLAELAKNKTSDVSSRMSHLSMTSDSSEDTSLTSSISEKLSQRRLATDIERNDSGVGSETSKSSRSKYQNPAGSLLHKNSPIHLCEDCDGPVETQITDSGVMYAPLVCRKCGKKRAERKEIITEIVETEEKYGRDLQIILEEFCQPMLVAGLLTQEQLSAIFLNTEELLENNQTLAERMRDTLDIALEQGDDDLLTVNVGKVFLEATPMLHAFESYCVRQASASLLLANLEKDKELLRIFLRVSQMENAVLRRMNLNSFLMVPVQRVTKYPLLLARLYKVTPAHLEGRALLKQAQEKIELHLNHMNQEAKDVPTKLWRRISSSSPNRRSSCEIDMINIKLRKMAIDILEWNHDEVRFAMEGKLLFTQPTDSNWKKGRTIKLTHVNALLVTNGKPSANYKPEKASADQLNFSKHTGIREASLLLVKEKCGRYTLIREPLYLDRCVVCTEADWDDYFEVHEISSKDTYIFKAEDAPRTKQWYTQLQYHGQGMGAWRKRRNALANIMINGMLSRT